MDIGIADAKNRLPESIRAVETGERVIITRHGKAVAQIMPTPRKGRKIRFGEIKDWIRLASGWDTPVSEERFLEGNL